MKKIFIFLFLVPIIICCSACWTQKQKTVQPEQPSPLIPVKNNSDGGFAVETADVWTPTFQLCWNELINLLGTKTVEYINGNPPLADELNKQKFQKSDLNGKDYYISVSKQTLQNKKKIEKAIKEKFNETSDILAQFNFPNIPDDRTNEWFIYSILIKNFPFSAAFDILSPEYFNDKQDSKYKYFGIISENSTNKENVRELKKHITPLFYANDDDFALSITDKSDSEEMILYLTDSNKSFDEIFDEIKEKSLRKDEYTKIRTIQQKQGDDVTIVFENKYKVPYLDMDKTLAFDSELANKPIKNNNGEDFYIKKTIQTIKFKLDNTGAKLKSEAAISGLKSAMYIKKIKIYNNYYFNRPFVIFLKEKNKDKPYFAARIKDGKYLVKGE